MSHRVFGHFRAGQKHNWAAVLSAELSPSAVLYPGIVLADILRNFWAEPAQPDPPTRSRWDWIIVPTLMVAGVAEGLLASKVGWPVATIAVATATPLVLVWRRTHPLGTAILVFSLYALLHLAMLLAGVTSTIVNFGVLAVTVYSLVRWASGRHAVIGLGVGTVATAIAGSTGDLRQVDSLIGLPVVWIMLISVGLAVRSTQNQRLARIREAKISERNRIARELHDTVAHHISAIAVQAQGGQEVMPTDPAAASEALAVIEHSASRMLTEMRKMVGALRHHEDQALVTYRGLDDIALLVGPAGPGPRIDVELAGNLEELNPSLEAGLYRLTQEAITNVRRHARHATHVTVEITGSDSDIRLTVTDDGATRPQSSSGYGLVGMTERANLLGGTFKAGPRPGRGWIVDVRLPRGNTSP